MGFSMERQEFNEWFAGEYVGKFGVTAFEGAFREVAFKAWMARANYTLLNSMQKGHAEKTCGSCGHPVRPHWKYCQECGSLLSVKKSVADSIINSLVIGEGI